MFGQHLVAAVGAPCKDLFARQTVGQRTGADDFDPVSKNKQANRGIGKKIPMHQRIDQQFNECFFGNFQQAHAVEALRALHMVQIALDKTHAALKLLFQRALDVFAIKVAAIREFDARKANRSNHANVQMSFGVFAKQQHAREIGHAVAGQLQVFKHVGQRQRVLPVFEAALDIAGKRALINVIPRRIAHGHLIGLQQTRLLKHALQLFAGGHMALVGTMFYPHAPLQVHIRLVETQRHIDQQNQPLVGVNVLAVRADGRAHMLAGRVGQQLIQAGNILRRQPDGLAIVRNANQNLTANAIGQRRQLCRQRIGVVEVAFELVLAVFTTRENLQEFVFRHGLTQSQNAVCGHPCPGRVRS